MRPPKSNSEIMKQHQVGSVMNMRRAVLLLIAAAALVSTTLATMPLCSFAQSTQSAQPAIPVSDYQAPGIPGTTPLPAPAPADFAPTNYVTQFAEQDDGAFSPQSILEGTMDTLLAPLSGAFNIVHDITSAVFSALIKPIGQLAGSILALFIKEVMKPLTTYLMGILQWFVLNPNIPLALETGGDNPITSGQVNPFAADKKFDPTLHNIQVLFEQMKTVSLDISLVLFVFSIWRKWLEGAFKRSGNLMGTVGRLIFTMLLILTWQQFYKFELMITNEMVKAIFFNTPVEFELLNSALIDALLAAIAAGGGLAVETFAPVIGVAVGGAVGSIPGAVVGGAIGAVIGFIGLVMFAIFGAILIAQMVYLLVLKAIQTSLLVAQYVFADIFLVFYASPDTEQIASTYIKSFIEVSLWTFAWLGIFKIMVIVLASPGTWGKFLIVIGLLQIMISIPKWIGNAQISPASDFINPKMLMGHIQEGAKRVGKVADAVVAGGASTHVDGKLIKSGRADSTFTPFGGGGGGQNLSPSGSGSNPTPPPGGGPTPPRGGANQTPSGGGASSNPSGGGATPLPLPLPGVPMRRPGAPAAAGGPGSAEPGTQPLNPSTTLITPGVGAGAAAGTGVGIGTGAGAGSAGGAAASGAAASGVAGPAGMAAAGAIANSGGVSGSLTGSGASGTTGGALSSSTGNEPLTGSNFAASLDLLQGRFNRADSPKARQSDSSASGAGTTSKNHQSRPAGTSSVPQTGQAPAGTSPDPQSGQAPAAAARSLSSKPFERGKTLNFAPEGNSQNIDADHTAARPAISGSEATAPPMQRPAPPPIPERGDYDRGVRSPINANNWFGLATTGLRQFQQGREGLHLDRFGRAGVSYDENSSLARRAQLGMGAALLEQGTQDGGFIAAAKNSVRFSKTEGVAAALHFGGRTGSGVRQFVDTELGKERMRQEMTLGTMHYLTGGQEGRENSVSRYLTTTRGAYGDSSPDRGRQVQDDLAKYSYMISPARIAADHNATTDAQSSQQVGTPMRDGLGKYIERQFADHGLPPGSYSQDRAIAFSEQVAPPLVWGSYAVASALGPDAVYDNPDLVHAVAHVGASMPGNGSSKFKYESAYTAVEHQLRSGAGNWKEAEERALKLQMSSSQKPRHNDRPQPAQDPYATQSRAAAPAPSASPDWQSSYAGEAPFQSFYPQTQAVDDPMFQDEQDYDDESYNGDDHD